MQITPDLATDLLDTLAFFLVTPDLIGKERLDSYGRQLDRWLLKARTFVVKVLAVARPGGFLLGWLAIGIMTAFVIIVLTLRSLFNVDNIHVESIFPFLAVLIVCPFILFLLSMFLAGFIIALRLLLILLTNQKFSGVLLLTGAILFLISRGIQIHHHLG